MGRRWGIQKGRRHAMAKRRKIKDKQASTAQGERIIKRIQGGMLVSDACAAEGVPVLAFYLLIRTQESALRKYVAVRDALARQVAGRTASLLMRRGASPSLVMEAERLCRVGGAEDVEQLVEDVPEEMDSSILQYL